MVKEAGERFVADLVGASEVPVGNKRCDDRAGRPSLAIAFEFVIEADATHSFGTSAPSLMWLSNLMLWVLQRDKYADWRLCLTASP